MKTISVFGSINADQTYYMKRLPKIGETLKSDKKMTSPGGKGLNQAVAAARLGSDVHFIGAVGEDAAGVSLIERLENEQIHTAQVRVVLGQDTGEATIFIQEGGKNMIVINSGANDDVRFDSLHAQTDILITQFEVPIEEVTHACIAAKQQGAVTFVNPAPAKTITTDLLKYTDVFIPNETELAFFLGHDLPELHEAIYATVQTFFDQGVQVLIVTMGEKGSLVCTTGGFIHVDAFKVNVVDTTAAGDSFVGAFAHRLDSARLTDLTHLQDCVRFANRFASYVVQRPGAMVSIPTADEIQF
ncbi:MAG: ribokinase [Bacilli bacterium]